MVKDVDDLTERQVAAFARGLAAHSSLAWLLSKPVVSCPIVGATKPKHLQDAVAALEVTPTAECAGAIG